MPIVNKFKLLKKDKLKPDIFKFSIKAPEIANIAKPRSIFRNKSYRYNSTFFKKTN